MNRGYAGLTHATPHVCREILLRLDGTEGSQPDLLVENLQALVDAVQSLGEALDAGEMVSIHHPEQNHTNYVYADSVVNHIQSLIGELLQHVCVIGEVAADLLGDMYAYAEMVDTEMEPDGMSRVMAEQTAKFFRLRQ